MYWLVVRRALKSEEVMKEAWEKITGVVVLSQPRVLRRVGALPTIQGPPRVCVVTMERFWDLWGVRLVG